MTPFLAALALACADPSGPSTHEHQHRMLIAGTEEGTVVVDLDWRGVIRRTGPRFISQGPTALRGLREIVTSGRVAGDSTVVAGLDVETGVELWRMTAARGNTPVVVDGVELGAIMLTANPSRPE